MFFLNDKKIEVQVFDLQKLFFWDIFILKYPPPPKIDKLIPNPKTPKNHFNNIKINQIKTNKQTVIYVFQHIYRKTLQQLNSSWEYELIDTNNDLFCC